MRTIPGLPLIAALTTLSLLGAQSAARGESVNALLNGAQTTPRRTHTIVVPAASVEQASDLGRVAHANARLVIHASAASTAPAQPHAAPYTGYGYETPASLACLHGLAPQANGCNPNVVSAVSTRGGRAIAIVDAYHYPTALADLQAFSNQFGLPAPTASNFQVVYASGVTPARNVGWELEEALDIEYAHALAPNATLYLVEAASASFNDLLLAVDKASQLVAKAGGGEVSMSWGGAEFAGQTGYDAHFSTPGVVYFASTGDAPGVSWPSTSPNVVSVGGLSVSRTPGSFAFEHFSSWTESGSGVSAFVARPAYQASIAAIAGPTRAVPDIAGVANPETGAWVFDSGNGGWTIVGGTSLAAPITAAIVNASGSFAPSSQAQLTKIYSAKAANAAAYGAAATGYCGVYATYTASAAWNFCTGVGAPISLATQ